MSKAEIAANAHGPINCTQAILSTYAADYGLDKDKALQVAVAFGGVMGGLKATCGAVSGALMVLGLSSDFKEGDSREKINAVYKKVNDIVNDFIEKEGTIKCHELLGCDLGTAEGRKFYAENNYQEKCRNYVRLACELFEKHSF